MTNPFSELHTYLEKNKTHTLLTLVLHGNENPVLVRLDLTVKGLIDAAKRKLGREEQEKRYALYLHDDPLPLGHTISELIQARVLTPQSKVIMRVASGGTRLKGFQLLIVDVNSQREIAVLTRFPVTIGRWTPDTPDVVDVSDGGGKSISRRHAEIREEGGQFVIKCLSERGLTVNGELLAESQSVRLTLPADVALTAKSGVLRIEKHDTSAVST